MNIVNIIFTIDIFLFKYLIIIINLIFIAILIVFFRFFLLKVYSSPYLQLSQAL